MITINNKEITKYIEVISVKKVNAKKNKYFTYFNDIDHQTIVPGKIIVNAKINYSSDDELLDKLNNIEMILDDGVINVDGTDYDVKLLSGLDEDIDFENFNLVFSWSGIAHTDGKFQDMCE